MVSFRNSSYGTLTFKDQWELRNASLSGDTLHNEVRSSCVAAALGLNPLELKQSGGFQVKLVMYIKTRYHQIIVLFHFLVYVSLYG